MEKRDVSTGRNLLREIERYKCNIWPCDNVVSVNENEYKFELKNPIGSYERIFDEQGALCSETYFNAEGEARIISKYVYDAVDCMAEIQTVFTPSNEKSNTRYFFYPNENVIEEFIHYEDGIEKTTIFMIDSRNRIAGKYDKNNRDNVEFSEYGPLDRITKYWTENIRGETILQDDLEYGDFSEYVLLNSYSFPGKIHTAEIQSTYTNDTHGNWLHREDKTKVYEAGHLVCTENTFKIRQVIYRS